ncbi:hypothetical protein [Sciscionella marina]|uniref:hypothetical protein n=1 Tax=Sciscionella marina TaxID=508770 RepID=UPI000382E532|nr:hypothetical protein [Sciscionella marina]
MSMIGATFMDVVPIDQGSVTTIKVPTDVRNTERGGIQGACEVGTAEATVFNHASAHGLNAVIGYGTAEEPSMTTES